MTAAPTTNVRILAVYPAHRGFGFVVLEDTRRLVDWGFTRLYSRHPDELLIRVEAINREWSPSVLVLEDTERSKRGTRAKKQVALLKNYSDRRRLVFYAVSDKAIATAFGHPANKYEQRLSLVRMFPELAQHMVPKRKPWQSDHERTYLFAAACLAAAASSEQA